VRCVLISVTSQLYIAKYRISCARQAVQGWLAINKQSFHLSGSFEQLQRAFIRLERWEDLIRVRQEYPDLHEKMPVALHAVEIPRTPSMMANPCNLLPDIEDQDAIGSNDFSQMTHDLASVESAMVYY